MADFEINGLAELKAKLRKLPPRIGLNATRRALRKGANVIRDKARRNAASVNDPRTPEDIAKNIVVQGGGRRREKQVGGPLMRVGVLGGAKARKGGGTFSVGGSKTNPGGDTFYWRFLEFGTSDMPAQPFMLPAARESEGPALNAIVAAMRVEFDKELAKL